MQDLGLEEQLSEILPSSPFHSKEKKSPSSSSHCSSKHYPVASIRERDNEIDLKFAVELEWLEPRAKYHNLKDNMTQNSLEVDEIKLIWIPKLVFRNNKNNDDTLAGIEKSQVYVKKKGFSTPSPMTSADEIEIFEGDQNPLTMIQSYTKDFKCLYAMSSFPFDTQASM